MSTPPDAVRALADELHAATMAFDPLSASFFGLSAYDAALPDVSAAAGARHADQLRAILARAAEVDAVDAQERITLAALVNGAEAGIAWVELAMVEHVVFPFDDGPGRLFMAASQTRLATAAAASAHLERARGYAGYLEACAGRLRAGAAEGRTPVAALVDVVDAQLTAWLARDGGDPLSEVAAPAGADGFAAELAQIVETSTRPAIARYHAVLGELQPLARSDDRCGLLHLPGGAAQYDRLVALHTTLPLTAREVHEVGLAAVADLVEGMIALGAGLGIDGLPAVLARLRAEAGEAAPAAAMAAARAAVARAESLVPQYFPAPLPAPCAVEPMDAGLARAGIPPHYAPPTPDGARPGTYWYNAEVPGAGSGWDLEATAYHEAVPGHHLQLARDLLRTDLPAIQRQTVVTVFAEGWGLYAEVLAGEMGLYSDDRMRLGALGVQAFRAARLVVDTGLHALGWTRPEAIAYLRAHVPLPEAFLVSEVNRYLAMPGQALAYMTGQRELLRLRGEAVERLGDAFDLRGFHAAVLDNGQIPLPALRAAVESWIEAGGPVPERAA